MNGSCGNGINLFGNNGDCHRPEKYVTEKENNLSTALAISESERFTETKMNANLKELYVETLRINEAQKATDLRLSEGLINTSNSLGLLGADVKCLQKEVERNREEGFRNLKDAKEYTDVLVSAEARERACKDDGIITYTNGQLATKISGVLGIDSNMINYNRCQPVLEQCSCGTPFNPFNVVTSTSTTSA